MQEIFLVWATTREGTRTVLHAFAERTAALQFIARAERHPWQDDSPGMSPCEALDVRLSIETVQVKS